MAYSSSSVESGSSIPDFKVVFVGDSSVGKTSIINRYYTNLFSSDHQATIGAGFVSKEIMSPYGRANLHIWDTAGQERYKSLVPMYSRGASVAIVVFDVTEPDTFDHIPDWIARVKQDVSEECTVIIAANKCDLGSPKNQAAIKEWEQGSGYQIVYVSAKTGERIDLLFSIVANALPSVKFTTVKEIDVRGPAPPQSSSCC